jgi:predicted Zn-dependent peptidase
VTSAVLPLAAPRSARPGRTVHTLANGLQVALDPAPHLSTACVALSVRVGSRHERPEESGISHFLEHMVFRGTRKHPTSHAWNDAFESLGGTLSAATSADHTIYDVTVPPDAVPVVVALLAEAFEPILSHVDVEKRVAREEILEHLDEDGRNVDADDLIHRAAFGDHPLGLPILGTEESLDGFTREQLFAWHAEHYVAANAVLAVAGNFDANAVLDAAAASFAQVPRGARLDPAPFVRPEPGPRFTYVDSVGAQTDVRIAFASPRESDPLHPGASVLAQIIDDGMSARLFRTIVEDKGLAYDTFGELTTYDDTGLYVLGASCAHESTETVTAALLELVMGIADGPIEAHEIEKAKRRATFGLEAANDDATSLANLAADSLLFQNGHDLETLRVRTEGVTEADVRAAARAIFRADTLQVVAVGSLTEEEEASLRSLVTRTGA